MFVELLITNVAVPSLLGVNDTPSAPTLRPHSTSLSDIALPFFMGIAVNLISVVAVLSNSVMIGTSKYFVPLLEVFSAELS